MDLHWTTCCLHWEWVGTPDYNWPKQQCKDPFQNLNDISHVERNRVSMYVVGVVAFQKLSSSARLSSPSSQSLLQNNRNVVNRSGNY